jgi:integrase/recombinase XerC
VRHGLNKVSRGRFASRNETSVAAGPFGEPKEVLRSSNRNPYRDLGTCALRDGLHFTEFTDAKLQQNTEHATDFVAHVARTTSADRCALGRRLLDAWSDDGWTHTVSPAFELMSGQEIHAVAAAGVRGGLHEEVALIGSQLPVATRRTPGSLRSGLQQMARFVRRLELEGVKTLTEVTSDHVQGFIDEPIFSGNLHEEPSPNTMHARRDAVRLLLRLARELHIVGVNFDPTVDLVLPPSTASGKRPLTDEEESLGRLVAGSTLQYTRRAAAWAIGQATGVAGEQWRILIRDVHLAEATIDLPGSAKRGPRLGHLTAWGVERLAERIRYLEDEGGGRDTPVIRGPKSSPRSAEVQTCQAIREVLIEAGLGHEPDIYPGSLPNWAGRRVFDETGKIEDAAKALGLSSLDTVNTG